MQAPGRQPGPRGGREAAAGHPGLPVSLFRLTRPVLESMVVAACRIVRAGGYHH